MTRASPETRRKLSSDHSLWEPAAAACVTSRVKSMTAQALALAVIISDRASERFDMFSKATRTQYAVDGVVCSRWHTHHYQRVVLYYS